MYKICEEVYAIDIIDGVGCQREMPKKLTVLRYALKIVQIDAIQC